MWVGRTGFQLRMELDTDKPGMVRCFDHFHQPVVGRNTGNNQAMFFEHIAVSIVHFVAVAVTF